MCRRAIPFMSFSRSGRRSPIPRGCVYRPTCRLKDETSSLAMPREACLEPFLRNRAQRRAQAIDHRRRRGVVVDARRAPVARELAEIQVIAAHISATLSQTAQKG